jgi:hypothetical protein
MLRNTAALLILTLTASLTASADFSYTSTQKITGGSMGAMAGTSADRTSKYCFKGQRMISSSGGAATIIDFGAQTVTTIDNAQKTYTVRKFDELGGTGANADVSVDVKDTGQTKNVNGYNASETIVTMSIDVDPGRGGPVMKMQMEMDMWISAEVPGAAEVRDFYRRNAASFPWSAIMAGNGNQSMQKAMAQMQRKMGELNGVAVEQIIRMKQPAGAQIPQMPQTTPAQAAQMQAAMAEMAKQGGANAAAQQAMRSMARGGAGGSGSLIETTVDSSGFSNASVPDSVFAVPEGYKQSQ